MSKERIVIPDIDKLVKLRYEAKYEWSEIQAYLETVYGVQAHITTIRSRITEYMRLNKITYDEY